MFKKLAPHRWISWRGLQAVGLCVFYIAFCVGVYALWQWGSSFLAKSDASALSRRLYLTALLQAVFICLASGAFIHSLKVFALLAKQASRLTPKK